MRELIFFVIALLLTAMVFQEAGLKFVETSDNPEEPVFNNSSSMEFGFCSSTAANLQNKECEESVKVGVEPRNLALMLLAGFLIGGWLASYYRQKWKAKAI